jgi:hypothetical protein
MSKIQDVPFITKVIDTLSDELKSGLYDLIDGQVKTPIFRSLVNNDYAITEANDKGKVQFVTLETLRGNYTGYLAYNSVYCVLIAFKGNTQALDMLNINVAKHTFAFVNESLSILELRVELEDGKEGVTPTDLGVTNNNIHLAKGTKQIGEGVNFKTINGASIMGDGNIAVSESGTLPIDETPSTTSENALMNKTVTSALDTKLARVDVNKGIFDPTSDNPAGQKSIAGEMEKLDQNLQDLINSNSAQISKCVKYVVTGEYNDLNLVPAFSMMTFTSTTTPTLGNLPDGLDSSVRGTSVRFSTFQTVGDVQLFITNEYHSQIFCRMMWGGQWRPWNRLVTDNDDIVSMIAEKSIPFGKLRNRLEDRFESSSKRILSYHSIFDCSSMVNSSHTQVKVCDKTRFSNKSKKVLLDNTSADKVVRMSGFSIAREDFKSITLFFYIPADVFSVNGADSCTFCIGFDGINYFGNSYNNGRTTAGWNALTFSLSDLTSNASDIPELIQNLYIKFFLRNNVIGTYAGAMIFDSIVFNLRCKPTVLLNLDQWWDSMIHASDGDRYAIFANRYLPFTMFTEYDQMTEEKKKEALKFENQENCENAMYGGFVASETATYANSKEIFDTQNAPYVDIFGKSCISWGCRQNAFFAPLSTTLQQNGIRLIRSLVSDVPKTYYAKNFSSFVPTTDIEGKTDIEIKALVDKCIDRGCVMALFTHGICDDGSSYMIADDGTLSSSMGTQKTYMLNALNYIRDKRDAGQIDVMTFEDFYNSL